MDLGANPPGIELCWVPSPPPPPPRVDNLFQTFSNLWKLMEF